MFTNQEQYDEVYVISDLHLGGQGDFKIFKDGNRLSWLIDYIEHLSSNRKIALVLNGDIVDFLADQNAKCFDPVGAVEKLERVLEDPSLRTVWSALQSFLRTHGRTLVLVLGNHDIELALPAVSHRLLWELCADDVSARGRVRVIFDNSGFACTVANARVLCVHGNEVDKYNIVDHENLRRIVVAINRGLDLPEMTTNAGSYLVVNVMNQIKRRYPFVDLLKPETKAALTLLALIGDESVHATILQVFDFSVGAIRGQHAVSEGRLGTASELMPAGTTLLDLASLRDELLADRYPVSRFGSDPNEGLLQQAERDLDQGLSPIALPLSDGPVATLGGFMNFFRNGWIRLTGKDQDVAIREAMTEWLKNDHTFAIDEPDEQFQRLSATTSQQIDFLVAGHTHLARALRRSTGGYYFNSGTWSQLIELTPELLGDGTRFATVLAAMRAHSMAALEQVPGLVRTRPTVVCLREIDGRAVGSLEEVAEPTRGSYALVAAQSHSHEGNSVEQIRFIQE